MEDLVNKLIAQQKSRGWSDGEMARRLGISRTYWVLVRHGQMKVGQRMVKGILTAFPELTPETLLFLRSNVSMLTSSDSMLTQGSKANPPDSTDAA